MVHDWSHVLPEPIAHLGLVYLFIFPYLGAAYTQIKGNCEEVEIEQRPGKIRHTRESKEFTGQQSLPKTPIPIKNSTGTFKVPSPDDSDWSESESEEEEGNTAAVKDIISRRYPSSKCSDLKQIFRPSEYEALREARAKALQDKPRNPRSLSQSSRPTQVLLPPGHLIPVLLPPVLLPQLLLPQVFLPPILVPPARLPKSVTSEYTCGTSGDRTWDEEKQNHLKCGK